MSTPRSLYADHSVSLFPSRWASRAFLVMVTLAALGLVFSTPAPLASAGGNYYVDSQGGSDSNIGTSEAAPWRSLAPVHARKLLPGDVVHFKRGSSWTGGLVIDDSGSEGSPITFTTYGAGSRPAFSNPGGAGSWTTAVTIRASWVVLEGVLAQDAHEAGVAIPDGSNHNIVRDVEATNVGVGVSVYADSNLVTQSYMHDLHMVVNTPGGDDDYGAVAVILSGSGNEVSYNRMENCIAPSYDYTTDGGAVEWWAVADSNYVHHNWAKGNNGFFEVGGGSANDTVVAYNVSIDNGDFFYIHLGDQFGSEVENFRIENNTIVERSNGESRWMVFGFSDNPTSTTLLMRNNIIFVDGFQGVANAWGFTHANNLYDLHNVSQGGFSLGPGEFTADPLFTNPITDDFHLQAGSPAIDSGLALGHSLDFDGLPVPAGAATDLGAYEFGSTATTFVDVPFDHPYHGDIEALYGAGYTAGCATNPLRYCPDQTMNRAESAVFVERGIHGTSGLPPQPTAQTFADLPLDSWAAKWAEALWVDGYTAGCGTNPLVYCPWQGHTRAEACVFNLRMLNGPQFVPPQPTVQTFLDVPLDTWYAKWVQAAYDAGLLEPCQTSPDMRFCPDDPLTRGLAAYVMVRAKGLLPSPASTPSPTATSEPTPTSTPVPPAVWRPFADESPWNIPIGDLPDVDPASDGYMDKLKSDLTEYGCSGIGVGLARRSWTIPVYFVEGPYPDSYWKTMYHSDCGWGGDELPLQLPIPTGAEPDQTADGHLSIIDRSSGMMWDFYAVNHAGSSWTACHARTHADIGNWSGVFPPNVSGCRESGFPLVAGLVRPEEIRAGRIEHALVWAFNGKNNLQQGIGFISPASHGSGNDWIGGDQTYVLPNGARLQLKPEVDISRFSRGAKILATAMREYGMYLGDEGCDFTVYLQHDSSFDGSWDDILTGEDYTWINTLTPDSFRVMNLQTSGVVE